MRLAFSLVGFCAVLLLIASGAVQQADAALNLDDGFGKLKAAPNLDDGFGKLNAAPNLDDVFGKLNAAPNLDDALRKLDAPNVGKTFRKLNTAPILGGAVGKLTDLWDGVTTRIRGAFGLDKSDGALARQAFRHPGQLQHDTFQLQVKYFQSFIDKKKRDEFRKQVVRRHKALGDVLDGLDTIPPVEITALKTYGKHISSLKTAVIDNAMTIINSPENLDLDRAVKYFKATAPKELRKLLNEHKKLSKTMKNIGDQRIYLPPKIGGVVGVSKYQIFQLQRFMDENQQLRSVIEVILKARERANIKEKGVMNDFVAFVNEEDDLKLTIDQIKEAEHNIIYYSVPWELHID